MHLDPQGFVRIAQDSGQQCRLRLFTRPGILIDNHLGAARGRIIERGVVFESRLGKEK